jgi:hypothetical protein
MGESYLVLGRIFRGSKNKQQQKRNTAVLRFAQNDSKNRQQQERGTARTEADPSPSASLRVKDDNDCGFRRLLVSTIIGFNDYWGRGAK